MLAANHFPGGRFKVRQPRFQLTRRQAALALRVVRLWNLLPPYVAEAQSFNVFLGAAGQRLGDNSSGYP